MLRARNGRRLLLLTRNCFFYNSASSSAQSPSSSSSSEAVSSRRRSGFYSWLVGDGGGGNSEENGRVLNTVNNSLNAVYREKLLPLEEHYRFHEFHSPPLDDAYFNAKPMILLLGQYSTGKTTLIRYLLDRDFPGCRIGPEPTTDRFIAVMNGDEEGTIPGSALVADASRQFRALNKFGNAYLNRFQCSTISSEVLKSVTIIDTPGILSGEKQRLDRGYDFAGVLQWFAERVDRILLLFDAHKLDISDEFRRCIEALSGNEDKIRIVLNKADMVDHQQLMRIYGALMWSLGKIFRTPEVARVYLGSFWDRPLQHDVNRRLFEDEQHDLFADLRALPRNSALRKLNDLIKRARLAKVHALIVSELRKQMPALIGKEQKKQELLFNLDRLYLQLQREHDMSAADFPDLAHMQLMLTSQDLTKFNKLKPHLLAAVDSMLASDIARIMAQIPYEEKREASVDESTSGDRRKVSGGVFGRATDKETPFGFGKSEGLDKGVDEERWIVDERRGNADAAFEQLGAVNGKISGRAVKEHLVASKLPSATLAKIWKLADCDRDGLMDKDEFALANYLVELKLQGFEMPDELPKHLKPPSKRRGV